MNTRARLSKLEARSGVKFRVAVSTWLDGDGNAFVRPPDEADIAGVRICVGTSCVEVRREAEEVMDELQIRAREQAMTQLQPTVILDPCAQFL